MDEFLIELQAKLDEAKSKENINADIDKINKIQNQINKLKIQAEIDPKTISNLTKQLENILSKTAQQTGTSISQNIANGINQSSDRVNAEVQKLADKIKSIEFKMDNGNGVSQYQNRIQGLINDFQKYGVATEEAKTKTNSLQQIFSNMKGLSGQELVTQADKLEQEFKAVKISVDEAKLSYDKLMQPASKEEITSTLIKVQKLLSNNTKVTDEVKQEWQSYVNTLSSGSDIAKKEINDIKLRLKETESTMRGMGKLGFSWTDKLKQAWEKFGGWGFATGTMMSLVNQLREMPKAVREIDTAMTNLYKVTDETDIKYNKFLRSACINAKELGRSVSSLVEQTANWAKLGFNIDDASKLAQISSIYANVGEVDDATAVSDIVTVMKAYDIAADDAFQIVNKYNKLGNEFATSAKDLGEGLSNSASMLAIGGTNINKALALLTGGAEITQSAGELGNALKIGQMRVQGMKGALEELGEEVDGNVESISKMQTHILNLTEGKVNIFDDNNNFKDYYDILEEISNVVNEMSSTDRADLLETLFGKNRANQGAAVLKAFQSGQVQKAYEATLNAEGSAMQEQEKWLESLEAKTQQFEAAFQSLSNTTLDSNLLKFFVDLGTNGVSALDFIINKFGVLNTLLVAGGGTTAIYQFVKSFD